MNIHLYRLLTILLSPVIDLYLLVRKYKGKEHKERFGERLGYSKIKRPEGKIIWFHAASVGESNSILPVIQELLNRHKNGKLTVLFTTGTISSAQEISAKIQGYNVIHQFVPIDKYFTVKRFLNHWKPDMFLMVESEFWPNLVTLTHEYGCPVIVINGKMSEKSFKKWKRKSTLKEQVFSCVDLCFPQSMEDKKRFLNLGVQNMNYLGNLKFDVPSLAGDLNKVKEIKEMLQNKKEVVAYASAHEKEEELIAQIHIKLKKKYPNVLSVIILKKPNRKDKVVNMLTKEYKLNVAVRTANDKITKKTDIYVCDTIGEMGVMFRAYKVVVMAGSLVDHIGGHTPVEPAKLNCAILTGPYIFNNKNLFDELIKNDACIVVKDNGEIIDNMTKEVSNLFDNPRKISQLEQNAYRISMGMENITKKIVSIIENDFKDALK
jgi:3-deoxy-D-manno-octulosonic-acid transferase